MDKNIDNSVDLNIVSIWLSRKPGRWVKGAVAGLIAGLVAMAVAGILSSLAGGPFVFPPKIFGTFVLGAQATEYASTGGLIAGLVVVEILGAFFGALYGQFVVAKTWPGYAAMGVVWGLFTWVFPWNLYFQAVLAVRSLHVNRGAAMLICVVYGVSLSVLYLIDNNSKARG